MYVCNVIMYTCAYVRMYVCMYKYTHTEILSCPVMFSTEILLLCSESLLTHFCLDRNESSRNSYSLFT